MLLQFVVYRNPSLFYSPSGLRLWHFYNEEDVLWKYEKFPTANRMPKKSISNDNSKKKNFALSWNEMFSFENACVFSCQTHSIYLNWKVTEIKILRSSTPFVYRTSLEAYKQYDFFLLNKRLFRRAKEK